MSMTGSFASVLSMFDECETILRQAPSEVSPKRRKISPSPSSSRAPPTCVSMRDLEIQRAAVSAKPEPQSPPTLAALSRASTPGSVSSSDSRSSLSPPRRARAFTQRDLEQAFLVFPIADHVASPVVEADEDEQLKAMLLDAIADGRQP